MSKTLHFEDNRTECLVTSGLGQDPFNVHIHFDEKEDEAACPSYELWLTPDEATALGTALIEEAKSALIAKTTKSNG